MSKYVVFVTGGLGVGKSMVCSFMGERGARIIDLDQIGAAVREIPEVAAELAAAFGQDILDDEGKVLPARLADAAFKNPGTISQMNAIMFPRISEQLEDQLASIQDGVVAVEIPLLPWAPQLAGLADEVLYVAVPLGKRISRAQERGMGYEDACRRAQLQPSDQEYRQMATQVIDNDWSWDITQYDLQQWWDSRVESGLF